MTSFVAFVYIALYAKLSFILKGLEKLKKRMFEMCFGVRELNPGSVKPAETIVCTELKSVLVTVMHSE